ncbi:DUF3152 domain-containing protein [Nocardioides campestrisoli]|uniref:DUF3152 domain-containing protein n=1 Tax=Nocardioides campestrisoli TaxID=2736757 RepID=UPI0015E77D8E|nr:DUF3152 domain-containing protein [Nocardioides campestrisoli]
MRDRWTMVLRSALVAGLLVLPPLAATSASAQSASAQSGVHPALIGLPAPSPSPSPSPAPAPDPTHRPPGSTETPGTEPGPEPGPGAEEPGIEPVRRPRVLGEPRWSRTLRAHPGRWTPRREETRYRWLRDGTPIPGARQRRYRIRPEDVGSRLRVQVRARLAGGSWATAVSRPTPPVRHLVPVRRVVTYQVETRGAVSGVREFARLAQETFDDPRGWRSTGVELRRVDRGGDLSLVLAEPSEVPRFSSVCSATWSCRVGRYVVINQARWRHASPAWNAAGRSLRDYRHMVVNHETGHWLGRGHLSCPAPGRLAPVMMQQSKGRAGCRFNPWPTPSER